MVCSCWDHAYDTCAAQQAALFNARIEVLTAALEQIRADGLVSPDFIDAALDAARGTK